MIKIKLSKIKEVYGDSFPFTKIPVFTEDAEIKGNCTITKTRKGDYIGRIYDLDFVAQIDELFLYYGDLSSIYSSMDGNGNSDFRISFLVISHENNDISPSYKIKCILK